MVMKILYACGMVAGIAALGVFAFARQSVRPTTPAASPSNASDVGVSSIQTQIVREEVAVADPRVSSLEERLKALEARSQRIAAVASARSEDPKVSAIRVHEKWASRFGGETVDRAWATEAESSISTELKEIGDAKNFKARSVACRTTMCAAELEWPDAASATSAFRQVVEHPYAQRCARTMYHPDAEDPNAPYVATLFFDCEKSRAR